MMSVDPVQQWSQMLRVLMRERERSGRSVEQQLGWSSGYLSQVLRSGPPALKVSHVHDLLGALEVEPAEFFARLYGRAAPGAAPPSEAYPSTGHPAPGTEPPGLPRPHGEAKREDSVRLEQIEQLVDRRIAEERDLRRQELARVKTLVDQALHRSRDRRPVDLDRIQTLVGEALATELRRLDTEREIPRQRKGRGDV